MGSNRRRMRNKPRKHYSALAKRAKYCGAIILTAFVAGMMIWKVNSDVTHLQVQLQQDDRDITKLEGDLARERAAFNDMTSVMNLERQLARMGIAMEAPKINKLVTMDRQGRPKESVAVELARSRNSKMNARLAQNTRRKR
ncbi:MAG: hypothetical protein IJ802_03150 [Kiritimatiellae bacterium]|nr:hypothetical protein [Kiritimatiellia bacterium]